LQEHAEKILKPLLRGWFHAFAAIAWIGVIVFLCWESSEDLPRMFSVLVFGVSTFILYAVSAIYHIFDWRGIWHKIWRTFDHANIFVLIAGTYTPICFNVLSDWVRIITLSAIWLMALAGIVISILGNRISRGVRTGFYLSMGWVSLLTFPALISVLPWYAVGFLFLGGAFYTVGALVYALRRPNPFPNYFGFHEIFHIFVIAGGTAFTLCIYFWVLPYPRI
jgi:hemolysin III